MPHDPRAGALTRGGHPPDRRLDRRAPGGRPVRWRLAASASSASCPCSWIRVPCRPWCSSLERGGGPDATPGPCPSCAAQPALHSLEGDRTAGRAAICSCGMPLHDMRAPLIERTRYELQVDVPVDQVVAALTDFGPDRPRIWRETSHPSVYRLHRLGDGEAEVDRGCPLRLEPRAVRVGDAGRRHADTARLQRRAERHDPIRRRRRPSRRADLLRPLPRVPWHPRTRRGHADAGGRPMDSQATAGGWHRALAWPRCLAGPSLTVGARRVARPGVGSRRSLHDGWLASCSTKRRQRCAEERG
jgi:hypothetical protein